MTELTCWTCCAVRCRALSWTVQFSGFHCLLMHPIEVWPLFDFSAMFWVGLPPPPHPPTSFLCGILSWHVHPHFIFLQHFQFSCSPSSTPPSPIFTPPTHNICPITSALCCVSVAGLTCWTCCTVECGAWGWTDRCHRSSAWSGWGRWPPRTSQRQCWSYLPHPCILQWNGTNPSLYHASVFYSSNKTNNEQTHILQVLLNQNRQFPEILLLSHCYIENPVCKMNAVFRKIKGDTV